jgi:hypothetical protein
MEIFCCRLGWPQEMWALDREWSPLKKIPYNVTPVGKLCRLTKGKDVKAIDFWDVTTCMSTEVRLHLQHRRLRQEGNQLLLFLAG